MGERQAGVIDSVESSWRNRGNSESGFTRSSM